MLALCLGRPVVGTNASLRLARCTLSVPALRVNFLESHHEPALEELATTPCLQVGADLF